MKMERLRQEAEEKIRAGDLYVDIAKETGLPLREILALAKKLGIYRPEQACMGMPVD